MGRFVGPVCVDHIGRYAQVSTQLQAYKHVADDFLWNACLSCLFLSLYVGQLLHYRDEMISESLATVLLFVSVGGPFVCAALAVVFDYRIHRSGHAEGESAAAGSESQAEPTPSEEAAADNPVETKKVETKVLKENF